MKETFIFLFDFFKLNFRQGKQNVEFVYLFKADDRAFQLMPSCAQVGLFNSQLEENVSFFKMMVTLEGDNLLTLLCLQIFPKK